VCYLVSMENKMTVNGKVVEDYKLHVQGDCGDDSWIEWAKFEDGTELEGNELVEFEKNYLATLVWG
jgi:hypothetical protein